MTYEIGDRVGAIESANVAEVRIFGYGSYRGREVPPLGIIGPFGEQMKWENPKILLDSGEVVWGCECWWAPEQKVKDAIGNRRITIVAPEEYRKRAALP